MTANSKFLGSNPGCPCAGELVSTPRNENTENYTPPADYLHSQEPPMAESYAATRALKAHFDV